MADLKSMDAALAKLEEDLEENPDKWFKNPCGFMKKPDFKREAQRRSSILSGKGQSVFSRLTTANFKSRWFVLESDNRVLRYYEDKSETVEKGTIDVEAVQDVDFSQLSDAPPFSIDLIAPDVHYTLTCQSEEDMYRWALAIKRLLPHYSRMKKVKASQESAGLNAPKLARDSLVDEKDDSEATKEKWHRYDFTYEDAGPIGLNVMGIANKDSRTGALLNQWVVVSSFEMTEEGLPGRSEASGIIAKDDYVVGVNGTDLTSSTFNQAFELIKTASWPKTLHFLRDNEAAKEASRIDSWAYVFYPALNRRRKRYCEVKSKFLNFRKAFPDGTVNQQREAFFLLSHISRVVPIYDKGAELQNPEQTYILQLHCKADSQVEHVSAITDKSIGGSPVEILELCFAYEQNMNSWRSALVSPSPFNGGGLSIEPMQIKEINDSGMGELGAGSDKIATQGLAIKSTLTGKFSERDFLLTNGTVFWKRPRRKGMASSEGSKRSLFLADSSKCDLQRISAFKIPATARATVESTIDGSLIDFKYMLKLQTTDSSLNIAFKDAGTMAQWQAAIQAAVAKTPSLSVPATLAFDNKEDDEDDDDDDDEGGDTRESMGQNFEVYQGAEEESGTHMFQGYLYKRNDRALPKGFSSSAGFTKVYVVFKRDTIFAFHSRIEMTSNLAPFMAIGMNQILEVREATDANVPENSFEIVTVEKVYTFAASDEDSMLIWLDTLTDLLEARDVSVQEEAMYSNVKAGDVAVTSEADRIKKIQEQVRFSGGVTMKSVNLYTGITTWRDRFVVISNDSLAYYSEDNDVYNVEKDPIGDVNLAGVVAIETSTESRCATNCAMDVTAAVTKGGDEDGLRTFIFEARTPDLCKQWMQELCNATEKFDLVPSTRVSGGYLAVKKANTHGVTNSQFFAGNAVNPGAGGRDSVKPGRRGSAALHSGRGGGRVGGGRVGGGRGFSAISNVAPIKDEADEAAAGLAGASISSSVDDNDKSGLGTMKVEKSAARRASALLGGPGRGGGRGGRGGGRGGRGGLGGGQSI